MKEKKEKKTLPENKYPMTKQYLKELHKKRGGGKAVLVAGKNLKDFINVIDYENKQHKKVLIKHLKESIEK